MIEHDRPPIGLRALSAFFAFGATMAGISCLALLFPRGGLVSVWRLNPQTHRAFEQMGSWAIALMAAVAAACVVAAVGLWNRARWGHRLALSILAVNLVGDITNALVRGDLRTLIGLPIGGALIVYLLRADVRTLFSPTKARG